MSEPAVPTAAVVAFLAETLGRDMVAYVACAERAEVKDWLRGGSDPSPSQETKLRACLDCTTVICSAYDVETAKTWLFGSPALLDREAPAWLIRRLGRHDVDTDRLVGAARQFCWA